MAPPRQHTSAVGARGAWGHFHSSGAGAAHAAVARPRGHSPFRLCASPPQLARSPAAAAAGADHTLPSPRPDGSQGGRRGAGQGLWRRLPRAATASAPADAGVSRLQPVSLSILTRTGQLSISCALYRANLHTRHQIPSKSPYPAPNTGQISIPGTQYRAILNTRHQIPGERYLYLPLSVQLLYVAYRTVQNPTLCMVSASQYREFCRVH